MAKGIYKRENIYWIRYADIDGRKRFESTKSTKFKDAEVLYQKRKQEVRDGIRPEIKRVATFTFKELSEKYLQWMHGRQKSERVKGYVIKQLIEAFGLLPLRSFTTALVEKYQTELISRGLKNCSSNKHLNVLKHMFNKAVDWEMVDAETLKRVRKVKLLLDDSKRLRYLSREECQTLINACSKHLRPIVITALNTGMRKSEFLSLTWDNVDLRHRDGFIYLNETKNGERREIPINQTLRETLQELGKVRRIDSPYVFIDGEGKRFKDVKRSFQTALKRAGIRDCRIHDLRHTFASHLIMAGIDITTVKELLGHKTLTMTLRYAHLAPAHKTKAVNVLDETLMGQMKYTKSIQSEGAVNG